VPLDYRSESVKPLYGNDEKPKPGLLSATLWSSARETRLVVKNGYDYPVIYDAFLIISRDGQRRYYPTSVCPVRPGLAGVESWPQGVEGVAMAHIRAVDPAHMTCNAGSALSLAPGLAKDNVLYACSVGEIVNPKAPIGVSLTVDSAGSIREAQASWSLTPVSSAPPVVLSYPLLGDVASPNPLQMSVFAFVGVNPMPKARAASIHLFLNGVERTSRPWRLYAKQLAEVAQPHEGKNPVAIVGVIPFTPAMPVNPDDDGLRGLLAAIGKDGDRLEVRIIGDDGSVLGRWTYLAEHSPVHSKLAIDPFLAAATVKAKTPTQCNKVSG
jgi:hypothetical protein